MTKDIAVAHEHYLDRGGGEHVADELARVFDAPVYAGLVDDDVTSEDVDPTPICQGAAAAAMERSAVLRDLVYWQAWRHVPALREYDIIIQSGNNPGWYIPTDDQVVVKYVHSPPRTPYDRWPDSNPGLVERVYAEATRQFYRETLARPDRIVANSDLVARRCELYWGIDRSDIDVVYPPTDTASFGPEHADSPGDYYVTFSRLYPSKRIGEIVDAFTRLDDDYQLVVGGSGPDRSRLEARSDDSVTFTGYLSEGEKRRRLAEANALIFNAANEDFGMVPVEALASGTPVLGVDDGFTRHQIPDGRAGLVYDRGADSLAAAVREFDEDGVAWTSDSIQEFAALNFGRDRFASEMQDIVADAAANARIDPNLTRPIPSYADGETSAVADGGQHD